jgi:hypothetical protein
MILESRSKDFEFKISVHPPLSASRGFLGFQVKGNGTLIYAEKA